MGFYISSNFWEMLRCSCSGDHTLGSNGLEGCMMCYKLPRWLSGEEYTCQVEDVGSVPGLGRYPEEEKANPLQYS